MKMDWRSLHGEAISSFLTYLNSMTTSFVLKGGTALAQCYGLGRFSEDIDLDARRENIIHHVQGFCKQHEYTFRIAKDTPTVKRCFVTYGNDEKPLKIEVSYRNQRLSDGDVKNINGIVVYSIDKLAQMKSNAYNARDKIRDLFDLAFIVNNYYSQLSAVTLNIISDALQYKGLEQVDYMIATQSDELINNDELINSFLEMHDKLGLLYDENEKEILHEHENVSHSDIAMSIMSSGGNAAIIDNIKNESRKLLYNTNKEVLHHK